MMKANKPLVGILIVLAVSVLATGGFIAYLTLSRAQEGNSTETSAEQALQDTPTIGPRIAYVSNQDDDSAIYTINTDGSDRQLVSSPNLAFCFFPSWSPDGQRVAYLGSKEAVFGSDDVPVGVWISAIGLASAGDESAHIQVSHGISNTVFVQPTWSPDGTRLAFVSREQKEGESEPHNVIHIAMADGSGVERDISFPLEIHELWWSPVKDELLIVSGDPGHSTHVHVMSSAGSEITEIYRRALSASWSSDGESVAVGDYTSLEILIIDLSQDDQNPTARPIARMAMQPMEVVWSPSGDHIAIATSGHYRQGYSTNLHVIEVESGETTVVVEGDGWVWWPRWSPDGQNLTFTWGELSITLLRGDLELWRNQILTFTGEDLPLADLWVHDVMFSRSEEQATGDGFEGVGVWSP